MKQFFTISTILFSFSSMLSSQQKAEKWTPAAMIDFDKIESTAVSPDGDRIAYTLATPVKQGKKSIYISHIWVVSTLSGDSRPFTFGEISCTYPAFSPDGQYLSYISHRGADGKNQIWLLPLNGGEATHLTNSPEDILAYAWSPDSKKIAYTSQTYENVFELEKTEKSNGFNGTNNARNASLFVIEVESSQVGIGENKAEALTFGEYHVANAYGKSEPFSWSPNGKQIVFAQRQSAADSDWPTTDISIVSLSDKLVKPLVAWSGADSHPLFSPDGKWVAFVSDGQNPKWGMAFDIYVVAAKGGNPKKLALTHDQWPEILSWSADGKGIFYSETQNTFQRLFKIQTNGSPPVTVTTGNGVYDHVSFSRDLGTIAFVFETPDMAPELYRSPTDVHRPVKLTDLHFGKPDLRLGKTEVFSWTSKNGLVIEALLTYPVRFEFDKNYPLVVILPDAPFASALQSYSARPDVFPVQALAQQGFAVLRPNLSGSRGYGKDFRFAKYADWEIDYADLTAGLDKIIGRGVAHPDSLCLAGEGYGAYLAAQALTKSNRFKAACVVGGFYDLSSFTGASALTGYLPDFFAVEPWDNPGKYAQHSPVFQVKNYSAPTLILHGADDRRSPQTQALELYNALKKQNVTADLVVYPETGHEITEPDFIVDAGERIINWLNHHLRKKGLYSEMTVK